MPQPRLGVSATLLVQFYAEVIDEHERVLAHLGQDPAYAAHIGDMPLVRNTAPGLVQVSALHLARPGTLSLDGLRRDIGQPGRLRAFLRRAGLSFV